MRSHKKQYFAIAALAFLFAAACGKNTYADATTINVSTPAQWYSALQTIHGSSNSEFIINLDADVIIDDASVVNNQAIDNGNTVTIIGNNHKIKFAIGGNNRFIVNGATLNLGKDGDADGTLAIEGAGDQIAAEKSLFDINSSTVNIYDGVTISNNYSRAAHLVGSALYIKDNSTINMKGGSINHNVITSSEVSAAIFMEGSNSTFNMTGGELTDNSGDGWGGAIFTYPQNTVIIKNATISRNKARDYGGALMIYGSTLTVENSTFEDNETTTTYTDDDVYLGGAILNYGSEATITSSTFTGNKAALGGAIANESGILTVSHSIFSNNIGSDKGGAIYSTGNYSLTSSNNNFSSNVSNNKGGAVYSQAKQFNSANDVIMGNTALIGGGIYLDKSASITDTGSANLSTTKIYDNKASTNANDLFISANIESVQIIDMSTVDEVAEYDGIVLKTDDWYTDNAGNRYSTSNITDVVAYNSLAASTEYSLTAAGEKVDDPTPDPAPAPDPAPTPEPIPDNPPTGDNIGSYIFVISTCSLGLGLAIKTRKSL